MDRFSASFYTGITGDCEPDRPFHPYATFIRVFYHNREGNEDTFKL